MSKWRTESATECGHDVLVHEDWDNVPKYCKDCKRSGKNLSDHEYTCRICGGTFKKAPPEWFEEKGLSQPSKCEGCKNSKPQNHTYVCRICKNHFEAAPPEWFENKDLTSPTRCKDCKSSGRRAEYEYICKINSDHRFKAAPPEWFEEKRLSLPTRCEKCKNGEIYKCETCPNSLEGAPEEWYFSRNLELPRYCKSCKKDRRHRDDLNQIDFSKMQIFAVDVPDDPNFYESVPAPQQHGGNQLKHILKDGHMWDESDKLNRGEYLLPAIKTLAAQIDPNLALQFSQSDGKIVKYDRYSNWVVVIKRSHRSLTGYMIETCYPLTNGDADVIKKIRRGDWII